MNKLLRSIALSALLLTVSANAVIVTLDITFDQWAQETGFGLFDTETASADDIVNGVFVIFDGIPYDVELSSPIGFGDGYALAGDFSGETDAFTTAQFIWDVAPGDYVFYITDDFGDGICCDFGEGSFSLSVGGNVIASGGEFESIEVVEFTAVPIPGALLLFGSVIAGWVGFGRFKST